MEKLLKQLASTNSRNEKQKILETVRKDKKILRALQLTYDPFTMFYIKKIDVPKSGKLNFDSSFNSFLDVAEKLSTWKVTGNDARDLVAKFLETCKPETQDVYIKILKKDLRVNVTDTTLNAVFGNDFIETFSVQLAKKYEPSKTYKDVDFWWASRKMDGLRCYYKNGYLLTRNGHDIIGFDHIIEELKTLPYSFVDGELYTTEINFQEIQGAVMSNKNIDPKRKKKIMFNVFAVGGDWEDTKQMVSMVNEIEECGFSYVRAVKYIEVPNKPSEINKICERFTAEGAEGVMLRDPNTWYEWKRSHALLKYKLFKEDDFKVVGTVEGKNKYTGMLGALMVEGKLGKVKIKSEVGTGFSDEDRELMWKDRKNLIGKIVEVRFQGQTDESDMDGIYSLRFPVFSKWKLDR
jgi:DNA ligase-1